MKRAGLLGASLCAFLVFSGGVATARQGEIRVAQIKGWRTNAAKVMVFSADGAPQGEADLRNQLQPGLLRWDPEFDMVKVTRDPGDTRWVRARELDLVFCQKPLVPKIVTGGGSNEIRALTMGSGEGCP